MAELLQIPAIFLTKGTAHVEVFKIGPSFRSPVPSPVVQDNPISGVHKSRVYALPHVQTAKTVMEKNYGRTLPVNLIIKLPTSDLRKGHVKLLSDTCSQSKR
jgi:hypothetical protein